jgi:hypothetical protein
MSRELSNEIAGCHAHAETCVRKAAEAASDRERDDYLRLQQCWLSLARSREVGERLDDFLKKNARRQAEFDRVSHREYRLFIYNQHGQIVEAPVISAVNYEEAAEKAEAIRGSSLAELLNVNTMRIVRHFPRTGK